MRDRPPANAVVDNKSSRFRFVYRLVVLLCIAAVIVLFARPGMKLRNELARLRVEGHPANTAELADFYAIPAGRTDTTNL